MRRVEISQRNGLLTLPCLRGTATAVRESERASGSARDQARQGANDADHRRGLVDDGNGGPRQGAQIEAAGVKHEGDATAVKPPTHQYAVVGSEVVIENGGG